MATFPDHVTQALMVPREVKGLAMRWRRRRSMSECEIVPFPRHPRGTRSCKGVGANVGAYRPGLEPATEAWPRQG